MVDAPHCSISFITRGIDYLYGRLSAFPIYLYIILISLERELDPRFGVDYLIYNGVAWRVLFLPLA